MKLIHYYVGQNVSNVRQFVKEKVKENAKEVKGQLKDFLLSPNLLDVSDLNKIGLLLGVVGTITNLLIIIGIIPRLFLRRNRAPNVRYSLIQAIFDCLACFSWCVCEYMRQRFNKRDGTAKEDAKLTQIICALYLSKSAFWSLFAYRSGITVLAAAHSFRRLVFSRIRMPIDTYIGNLIAHFIFVCHAAVAAVVHGLEVEVDEKSGTCTVSRDLFAQYDKGVGPIKVAVVAHISLMYTVPVMSTMYFYCAMVSVLKESRNPVHEKAYRDLKKIYFMDCMIYLVIFFPFISIFFLHHFSTEFAFGPMDRLYKVVFTIAFAYPALYPLIGVYLRRNFYEPLMSGLDFSQSRSDKKERAINQKTEEKVAASLEQKTMYIVKKP